MIVGGIVVAFLWALCFPLITIAVRYAPPLLIGAMRALIGGGFLILTSELMKRKRPKGIQWFVVLSIGISSTGMGFAGMFLAGGRVAPGIATVIANTQPLLAVLIGYFVLKDSLNHWQTIGLLTAFLGIAIVASPTFMLTGPNSTTLAGIGFVLFGAVGVAVGNVLMKRFAEDLDSISTTAWQLVFGSIALLVTSMLLEPSASVQWNLPLTLSLLGLAIPGTAIAFVVWFALLHRAQLNTLVVFNFLTPVFAIGFGMLYFGEHLDLFDILGSAFVMIGAWLTIQPLMNRNV